MVDRQLEPALVAGELRGYRQFDLREGGLYPLVHSAAGPWSGDVERARCEAGGDHEPPAAACRCGLYGWYLPGSATVALGPASAVVAARGRCVLGDRGFRAEAARVEAVALPMTVRWNPWAAARSRRALAEQYPHARVYRSAGRMLKDFPPQDVRALGIDPPPDPSRRYRTTVAALWAAVVVLPYVLAVLPRQGVGETLQLWWPLLVLLTIGWQVAMVWLVVRLMALQAPGFTTKGNGQAEGDRRTQDNDKWRQR